MAAAGGRGGRPSAPALAGAGIPQALAASIQQARLQAGGAAASDQLGNSVALSADGNTALVGAMFDNNSGGADAGSAYVFIRSGATWAEQARLQANDAVAEDHFGRAVALSSDGNTALVGATGDDNSGGDSAGSAYVFTRSGTTWTQQARLQSDDAAAGDALGWSVALSFDGNTALAGALFDSNSGGGAAGSAYVFTRSGTSWTQQARLQAGDAAAGDALGISVALSSDGNTALVGAYADDNSGGFNAGSAYIFVRSGAAWAEQARLQASDAAPIDSFGWSSALSADGNTALVGSSQDDTSGGAHAGSAYIFVRSGAAWAEQAHLQVSDATANESDQFGQSVALSADGNTALVGAHFGDNGGGADAGSAYVFTRSGATWAEQTRLQADDAAPSDFFGNSVALSASGDTALVGAPGDDNSGGSAAGSAYVFFTSSSVQASPLIISEFRVRGPNGANDEFVELYNNSGADHTVTAASGTGYAVAASDGTVRCVVPNGTVIPTRGHYLCVNSVGYSLAGYPAGNGTTATGDATYTTDIPDNAGIALFNNNTSGASFSFANRMDAVGSTSEANTLYKEGTGYPALTPFSIDYSFYRDDCGKSGSITTFGPCPISTPKDTNNNAADFIFVDTNGTSAGAGQRLGAPGPENLSSPIQRNASLTGALLDPCVSSASPPNRVRDFTSDPARNSTFGTLEIRRTVTNNTGANVTRLRFRVTDITTFPAPSGIADLRPRTSTAVVVTVDRAPCGAGTSNVTVQGTTLEQPPSQPNGGGFNSSLSAGTVTLATPLANGASIDVRFLLGIQQTGSFKFTVNIEALP